MLVLGRVRERRLAREVPVVSAGAVLKEKLDDADVSASGSQRERRPTLLVPVSINISTVGEKEPSHTFVPSLCSPDQRRFARLVPRVDLDALPLQHPADKPDPSDEASPPRRQQQLDDVCMAFLCRVRQRRSAVHVFSVRKTASPVGETQQGPQWIKQRVSGDNVKHCCALWWIPGLCQCSVQLNPVRYKGF